MAFGSARQTGKCWCRLGAWVLESQPSSRVCLKPASARLEAGSMRTGLALRQRRILGLWELVWWLGPWRSVWYCVRL